MGDNALLRRLLYTAFFIEVGLLLIVIPWSKFWDRNYFAALYPLLRPIVTNDFVRGAISGLGVVNLIAGFSELAPLFTPRVRHDVPLDAHETPAGPFPNSADTRAEP
jgi:polyferredoxin